MTLPIRKIRQVIAVALLVAPLCTSAATSNRSYAVIAQPTAAQAAFIDAPVTLGPDGLLYGVATRGGQGNAGSVFRVEASGRVVVVHSFAADGSEGMHPAIGLLLAADGWLYGAVHDGGKHGRGTIYKVAPDGTFRVVHQFGGGRDGDTGQPSLPLVQAPDGTFYGAVDQGPGASTLGALFRMDGASHAIAVLHAFSGGEDGGHPSSLAIDARGTLYGGTRYLGEAQHGTLFDVPTGQGLHTFRQLDGRSAECGPAGAIVLGDDGAMYGTTGNCNTTDGGVFRASLDGTSFTLIHQFAVDDLLGYDPVGGLAQDAAGRLVGTTYYGAAFNEGSVYQVSRDGVATTLHTFHAGLGGLDGGWPAAAPTLGPDGALYGSTSEGGAAEGTVYRIRRH